MSDYPVPRQYEVVVRWTGNRGSGTSGYRTYARDHMIEAGAKPAILGSSDPAFRGDAHRWNPEDMLVAALAACHQLWYLHLCSENGVVVSAYEDRASGIMLNDRTAGGRFVQAVLRPRVTVRPGGDEALALRLHAEAHARCFIANSLSFPVEIQPIVELEPA